MNERGRIDILIFLIVLGMMLFSLIVVYSASSAVSMSLYEGDADKMLSLHIVKIVIGIVVLLVFSKIPFDRFKNYSKHLLMFTIFLLLASLIAGTFSKGAYRQLQVGIFGFMPSDFARLALILHLGNLLDKKGEIIKQFKSGYLPALFWIAVCAFFILLQPNFSTAVIVSLVGLSMIFISGARIKHLVNTFLLIIPVAVIIIFSAEYRTDRFLSYVESVTSNEPINDQVGQSLNAFGSGEISGKGIGQSNQKYYFLPEAYGDFIYAVIGEEYGFIGTSIILSAYLLIVWRGFRIAKKASDRFHKYIAFGFTLSFGLYAFINAAVTLGIIPTTGITLPFLSYGGSSIVSNAAGIGFLLNISSINNKEENTQLIDKNLILDES